MKRTMKGAGIVFGIFLAFFIFQGIAIGADEINIGYSGALTGPMAYAGIDPLHGAQVAAKEINDAGGLLVAGKRYRVNIVAYDDEAVAAKAVAGLERLKNKYDIRVICQNTASALMGLMEKNEKMGVLIASSSNHSEMTSRGNKLVMRFMMTSPEECKLLANAIVQISKPKTYAAFGDLSDYGKSHAANYKVEFEKLGVKNVSTEWMDARSQTDFRSQLTSIKAANPDVIMLTAYDESDAGVIKQAHELGIKTPFAVAAAFGPMGENLAGGDLLEGYWRIMQHVYKVPTPAGVLRYTTVLYPAMKWKEPCGQVGKSTYETVHRVLLGMQKAGTTTDVYKIRQAIASIGTIDDKYNMQGITGWRENGDPIMEVKVGRYHNGKCEWHVGK